MAKTIWICDASFPFSIYTQLTIERVLSCHYKALLQSGHWSFVRLAGSLSVRFEVYPGQKADGERTTHSHIKLSALNVSKYEFRFQPWLKSLG